MKRRAVLMGGLLVMAIAVVAVGWDPAPSGGISRERSFPELGAPVAPCPVPPDQRAERAETASEEAEALARRYPFDARDGVLASQKFAEAAACATDGASEAASGRAARFRERLNSDYRAHRVALAVSLERKDWPAVKRDAEWLGRALSDPAGETSIWLSGLERHAEAGGE